MSVMDKSISKETISKRNLEFSYGRKNEYSEELSIDLQKIMKRLIRSSNEISSCNIEVEYIDSCNNRNESDEELYCRFKQLPRTMDISELNKVLRYLFRTGLLEGKEAEEVHSSLFSIIDQIVYKGNMLEDLNIMHSSEMTLNMINEELEWMGINYYIQSDTSGSFSILPKNL